MAGRFTSTMVVLLLGLSLAIILSEVLLRAVGLQPWRYSSRNTNEPTMHEPDSILGWKNKTGSYIVPPHNTAGQPTQVTFLEHGQRRTGPDAVVNFEGTLVLIGDSFTQGWAISDDETYAWKLQNAFPFFKVLNYGTGGYGSYQSLLLLERELPGLILPKFVLYGFLEHHEVRNVAPGRWLATLSSLSMRGHIDTPFAIFTPGEGLVRHPPVRYLSLPFRESLASIALVEKFYMDVTTRNRLSQKRQVTEQVFLQMNKISEEYNAIFVVVILYKDSLEGKEHYINFLRKSNIQVIDCAYDITDEMRVFGDGHPNAKMNTVFADCISDALKDQFENSRWSNTYKLK
jgi:hypothetical protein